MENADPNWWKTFFEGLALDIWRAAVPAEVTATEVDTIVKLLDLKENERLLDTPCGSGRLALPLAKRGLSVSGIDIAPENIELANSDAAKAGVQVGAKCGDVQRLGDFFPPDSFDAAICFGNSFGYFDDAGNDRFVESLFRALRRDGQVLVHTPMMLPDFESKLEAQRDWYEFAGDPPLFMLSEGRYDPKTRRWQEDNVMISGATVTRRPVAQRVWSKDELCALFESAGFADVVLLAEADGTTWRAGASCCYVRAMRP